MNSSGAQEKIVEAIRGAETVLVTVSRHPSVDELAAALGLTIYLNDAGKHATAVVSGTIPSAITFLNPEKTFQNTVDSLRDFVIALDKEKADHLRYKLDGDVVKIFITPYRTVITEKDLEYSQGDYNVEAVIALGVTDQKELDVALESHGKILHDATVATVGLTDSALGSIGWHDAGASSVSEMVSLLVEGLKTDESPITEPVASALLTGIVAATERFSNDKTNATVMTAAAKLMSYGANQQLIAAKLQEKPQESKSSAKETKPPVSQTAAKEPAPRTKTEQPAAAPQSNNLAISHDDTKEDTKEQSQQTGSNNADAPQLSPAKPSDSTEKIKDDQPKTPGLPPVVMPPTTGTDATPAGEGKLDFEPTPVAAPSLPPKELAEELAKEAAGTVSTAGNDVNHLIDEAKEAAKHTIDSRAAAYKVPAPLGTPPKSEPSEATLADIDKQHRTPLTPEAPELPKVPQMPLESTSSTTTPAVGLPLPPAPDFSQLPPLPPAPDFSQLPPLPEQATGDTLSSDQPLGTVLPPLPPQQAQKTTPVASPTKPADPGQFKIPSQ